MERRVAKAEHANGRAAAPYLLNPVEQRADAALFKRRADFPAPARERLMVAGDVNVGASIAAPSANSSAGARSKRRRSTMSPVTATRSGFAARTASSSRRCPSPKRAECKSEM